MPKMNRAERIAERERIWGDMLEFKKANPKATPAQIRKAMNNQWTASGVDPDRLNRWLKILELLLPLILKFLI